jgi:hypothetical protein
MNDNYSHISEVLHVPRLSTNLLSVNSIVNKGTIVLFTKDGCILYDSEVKGKVLAKSYPESGIYCLNTKANSTQFAKIATKDKINTKLLIHLHCAEKNVLSNAFQASFAAVVWTT